MKDDIIEKFKTDAVIFGAMYILPDGRMLDLSSLENGHSDLWAMLDCSAEELRSLGWLRLNTKIRYIDLPTNPTVRQLGCLDRVYALFGDDFQINRF